MKILVSNDDGVYAPGLLTLVESLKGYVEFDVVAPDRNRSGASNSLTLDNPLRVKKIQNGFFSVEGTPTDCVHLAVTGLLDYEPAMVISGINAGANLGDDVIYSGTVAAAMEGRYLGYPAIAVSLALNGFNHYATAAKVCRDILAHLKKYPLPPETILNVNVPDLLYSDLKGIEVARLGKRHAAEPTIRQIDPRGSTIYWVGPPGREQDAGPGTDFYAVNNGKVAVTPIHLDLTSYSTLDTVRKWADNITMTGD